MNKFKFELVGTVGELPWHWVSFADSNKPTGAQFLGVAIVRAMNVGHAAMVCWRHGCNPGGQVMAVPVPEEFGPPPPEWDHKLITDKARINELTNQWHGCDADTIENLEGRTS